MAEPAQLRLELFVADIAIARRFYVGVLGFEAGPEGYGGYTPVSRGNIQLAFNSNDRLPDDHPVKVGRDDRPGRGVEIVIEVDDIKAAYAHVQASGWPISSEFATHPWGLSDFRIIDPDGYYLRISTPD